MQHRLPEEPNDRKFGAIDAMLPEQAFDRFRVRVGHEPFGFGEDPWGARPSVAARGSLGERLPSQAAFRPRIGAMKARTRVAERDPVGLEESRIDPVEGGSTHEADGFKRDHGCAR